MNRADDDGRPRAGNERARALADRLDPLDADAMGEES